MKKLIDTIKEFKYDVRLQNFNLKNSILDQEELGKYLEDLEDVSNNSENLDIPDHQDVPETH